MIKVSGTAFAFNLPGAPYGRIKQGTVSILEMPDVTTKTDAEGYFEFNGLPSGQEASFVIEADGFPVAQTKTFTLPETDLERVTFQVPNNDLYDLIAGVLAIAPSDNTCQIVSTLTVVGKSLFDEGAHGEEGSIVTIDPPVDPERGPTYFNSQVLPDSTLTESSDDGGVVFTNIEPGEYVVSAHKEGCEFEDIKIKCRGGVLVNASPPYGLQKL